MLEVLKRKATLAACHTTQGRFSMWFGGLRVRSWVLAVYSIGCSSPDETHLCDVATVSKLSQPLVGGTTDAPIGLDLHTVLRLESHDDRGRLVGLCAGVRLAENAMITAAHCVADRALSYHVALDSTAYITDNSDCRIPSHDGAIVAVSEKRFHAEKDLAIVFLDLEMRLPGTLPEISPYAQGEDGLFVAGAGVDASGNAGRMSFAAVDVDEVSADWIDVRISNGGACYGDSGGALLAQRESGIALLGVLSVGSASCMSFDRYLRLDTERAWLADVLAPPS